MAEFDPCTSNPCEGHFGKNTCINEGNGNFSCICQKNCSCAYLGETCQISKLPSVWIRLNSLMAVDSYLFFCTDTFDCDEGPVRRAHVNDCSIYIDCSNGTATFGFCPLDHYYDPFSDKCSNRTDLFEDCELQIT